MSNKPINAAPRHYRGEIIWCNTEPGYRLRWSTLSYGAADTLAGMKYLIRSRKQKEKTA